MNKIMNQLLFLKEWIPFGFAGIGIIAVVFLIFISLILRRMKALKNQLRVTNQLLEHVQPSIGLEKNLTFILELIGSIIDAPVFSFYIYSKNGQYLLKAVRHSDEDFGKVRPSYSGLAAYKKEAYMPPISLMPSSIPSKVDIIEEGEVPLLIIPLGGRGVVRIGPIQRINNRTKKIMERVAELIQHALPEIVLAESMRTQVDVVLASGKALQNISDAAVDPKVTLEVMIGACSRAVGAVGGFFLEEDARTGDLHLIAFTGVEHKLIKELQQDPITMNELFSNYDSNEYRLIQQGEEDYYKLPAYLASQGYAAICTVPVGTKGALVLLFNRLTQNTDIGMNQLMRIAEELNEIIVSQAPLQQLSKVYINILKQLARMMDNLNPFTVGYSEQMSRYAIVIAKQLKLPEDEIRDIALAAYLSNIGVIGLSSELYQKEGKYSEAEFEMMKLHSEVGASIVSVTTGNKRVANYIMYHHERMDGGGYPAGLRGNDIPMGARIIAVVQTFLAKINGRKQRDPLPFDQALQMLISASGSQLDQQVVNGLINWFQSKRSDPKFSERSLGTCWEMCCSPSSICEHCPVYQNNSSNKNCWEFDDNLCNLHGKSCATCFVKTEVVTRKGSIRTT
jgi:hypothetical protein